MNFSGRFDTSGSMIARSVPEIHSTQTHYLIHTIIFKWNCNQTYSIVQETIFMKRVAEKHLFEFQNRGKTETVASVMFLQVI